MPASSISTTSPHVRYRGGVIAAPTGRSPGGDDIARLQHNDLRQVRDQRGHVEDHVRERRALAFLTVDARDDLTASEVRQLVRCHDRVTHRRRALHARLTARSRKTPRKTTKYR